MRRAQADSWGAQRACGWTAPVGTAPRRPQPGFTLVELIVVLAIGGLLLALTPPLITSALPGVELKAAARRTAGALRQTRAIAIGRGYDVAWRIDTKAGEYLIPERGQSGSLPDGIGIELVSASSEMLTDEVGGIRFYPDGTSSGGRVILKRGERGYQVGVNWLTGRVIVADWQQE